MRQKRNAYRILVGKTEGTRPVERPRHSWMDNMKMDLRKIGWMIWTELIRLRTGKQGRALVNTQELIKNPEVMSVLSFIFTYFTT
jgi:hypothetical protein